MDEAFVVNVLERGDRLVRDHEDCFEGKPLVASLEEVFEALSEVIDHHHMVIRLRAEPVQPRDAYTAGKKEIELGLVIQLWGARFERF